MNSRMDTYMVVKSYNCIHSNRNEQTKAIWSNMVDSHKLNSDAGSQVQKYQHWFHSYNVQKQANFSVMLELRIAATLGEGQWLEECASEFWAAAAVFLDLGVGCVGEGWVHKNFHRAAYLMICAPLYL